MTGSAPIEAKALDFIKICFSACVFEGYGQTESQGGITYNLTINPESGHVGGPLAFNKIRLRDIPDMNYLSTDNPPRGEILSAGQNNTPGYFLNPEKTSEAIKDGWLYTGDVGVIYPNGSVKIIDRAKNIFKLS